MKSGMGQENSVKGFSACESISEISEFRPRPDMIAIAAVTFLSLGMALSAIDQC
jgi:hypothetical protein